MVFGRGCRSPRGGGISDRLLLLNILGELTQSLEYTHLVCLWNKEVVEATFSPFRRS